MTKKKKAERRVQKRTTKKVAAGYVSDAPFRASDPKEKKTVPRTMTDAKLRHFKSSSPNLEDVVVFDEYAGPPVGENHCDMVVTASDVNSFRDRHPEWNGRDEFNIRLRIAQARAFLGCVDLQDDLVDELTTKLLAIGRVSY